MIVWLAFVAGLVIAVSAYSFGWWWRGRYEAMQRPEREYRLRLQWEWNRRLDEPLRPHGPPDLRVIDKE